MRTYFLAGVVLVLVGFPDAGLLATRGGGIASAQTVADAEAALELSFRNYRDGLYEEAVIAAKTAIAANPNYPEAYNNVAVSYLGLRMYDEAIQAAEEAIRIKPDYQLATNNLAWIQQEKVRVGLPPITGAELTQAVALLNQSLQQAQTGQFYECMATAREAARIDPGFSRAFNNLGFCAAKVQLWEEAVRNTQEAIRLDPSFELAKNNLAWIQQERVKGTTSVGRQP